MAAWGAFPIAFVARRWTLGGRSQTREPIAWGRHRAPGRGLRVHLGRPAQTARRADDPRARPVLSAALVAACVALAWISAGMMIWAIRTLGRHWAAAARLVEGHELVTAGPYRFVRNPIYSGLFGLAMATAGVLSHPWTIAVGAPLFLAGTLVRVRAEERLLRGRFGSRYDEFARRVPALLPKLRP